MSTPSASTEYELLVRDLHAALIRNDAVENVHVLHDVKVRGRSGATHQIDVFWEFKLAGVQYRTCIECKHHNRRVTKSAIASLATVVEDIGNATGIMATTVGYQSGAQALAKFKGIRLLTVNHLLKSVRVTSNFSIPDTEILNVKYDAQHARELLIDKGLDSFEIKRVLGPSTILFDRNGAERINLRDYLNKEILADGVGYLHPVDLFDQTQLGLLRVAEFHYRRTTHSLQNTQEIELNDTYRAIMEDVLENSSLYLGDDGTISWLDQANEID